MTERSRPRNRKLRRFFTRQTLKCSPHDLWLDADETHHLRDIIRLKQGDACLVTDGQGGEAEATVGEFSPDGCVCLRIQKVLVKTGQFHDAITLRMFPAMLRKGKTDFLVEKAQELGVHEFRPIFSEYGEVQVPKEKANKIVERWNRIAREASKQSGNLKLIRIEAPRNFKEAFAEVPAGEAAVVFHPGEDAMAFPAWIDEIKAAKGSTKALNVFIGPEGGFSEEEIRWARWHRKESGLRLVELGEVLFKADTAFVGIVASLRFSGILSQ